MATRLVVDHHTNWLLPGSPDDPRLFHADPSDQISLYPHPIGQGYRQSIQLRDDLTLVIMDYEIHREILFNSWLDQEFTTKFEFPISRNSDRSGNERTSDFLPIFSSQTIGALHKGQQVFEVEVIFRGHSSIAYLQNCFERYSPRTRGLIEDFAHALWRGRGGRRGDLNTMIKRLVGAVNQGNTLTSTYEGLPSTAFPDHLYLAAVDIKHANCLPVTPEMKAIIGQILSCPYQGETRRRYLEQKALELVGLRIEAIALPQLHPVDLDCIYQAASILKDQLASPPTVEELARQVNTNRLKLNQGFHEVYGTTPYKYLRECRLLMAQRLLTDSTLPVERIAAAVGYSSRNQFAKAFRKQTGLNPKLFQMQVWPEAS
ncbi:MAG: AraC family transcriptional regulator, partial [Cyanobacteria bacterium P01_F01_bin.153]